MKNERFCDRISQLVDYYGNGRNTNFANLTQNTESNVRSWLNNTLPKLDAVQKIARNCDNLSLEWLIFGEGSMLKNDVSTPCGGQQNEAKGQGKATEGQCLQEKEAFAMLLDKITQLSAENALLRSELERYQKPTDSDRD